MDVIEVSDDDRDKLHIMINAGLPSSLVDLLVMDLIIERTIEYFNKHAL